MRPQFEIRGVRIFYKLSPSSLTMFLVTLEMQLGLNISGRWPMVQPKHGAMWDGVCSLSKSRPLPKEKLSVR